MYVLIASGHIRPTLEGQPFDPKAQDRPKLRQATLHREKVTVTVPQRMEVRKLFTAMGTDYRTNEEMASLAACLDKLVAAARAAGGDPPTPAAPSTAELQELGVLTGNEQLAAIADKGPALATEYAAWQKTAAAIQARLAPWNLLQSLLTHAAGLEVAGGIRAQADSIVEQRALLAEPDPVAPLAATLAAALRKALGQLHNAFQARFDAGNEELLADPNWQRLTPEQRHEILAPLGLTKVPEIKVGTDAELVGSLNDMGLQNWRDRCEFLPRRFQDAKLGAAQFFEPKAQRISLPSATIRTEEDLEAWLGQVREQVTDKLASGPVVI